MRDLTTSWPAIPDWANAELRQNDIIVRSVMPASQHLVSGNLAAFSASAGIEGTGVGGFGRVEGETYALRLARDRLLAVNAPAASASPGWHQEGFAATDVSAMYHVFEIEGDGIPALLEEALLIDPRNAGPSAIVVFAGQQVIAYHHGDRLRLHIERGMAPYLWQWMEARD